MEDTMLKVQKGELLFIYNSNQFEDKRSFGYVQSLKSSAIKDRDISTDPLTMQQIAGLALSMDIEMEELLDPAFRSGGAQEEEVQGVEDEEDLLKFMQNNPESLKTPIIVTSDRTYFVRSGYDFVKEDMAVKGIVKDHANKQEKNK